MTDDQRAKYAALIALRNTEAALRWTRSQLFIFIQSAGLTLAVTQRQLGTVFLIGAGVFGFVLVAFWALMTQRANAWLDFWHTQLEAAENPPEKKEIIVFGSEGYVGMARAPVTIGRILIWLMIVFATLWAIVLLSALF